MSNHNPKQTGYSNNKNNRSYKNPRQQPCRGFPAIFFTCESGREKKCQREALELTQHYYYLSKSTPNDDDATYGRKTATTDNTTVNCEPLSLDEELKLLRKGAAAEEVLNYERNAKRPKYETKGVNSMKSPFVVHDNGMKGIVCVVFSLPGSEVIPYSEIVEALRPKEKTDDQNNTQEENAADEGKDVHAIKVVDKATNMSPAWDPIETVRVILKEVGGSKSDEDDKPDESNTTEQPVSTSPPGSRFILRMIPIQATCHASLNEIKAVTKSLLQNYLASNNILSTKANDTITFKIDFKKRNCSHLSREQIFEALVPIVMGDGTKQKYAVNLTDPDFSIRVEVCKTFCGISVLPRQRWYKNFNLAELIEPASKKADD